MSEATAVMVPEPMAVRGISQDTYDKQVAFREQLTAAMPQLLAVVPKGVRAQALASAALTAALDNPALLDCEPLSMVRAVYKVAALGLRIGETVDLVPTKKGARNLAEAWIRVKGTVELAIRSGAVQFVREGFVVNGDEFEHEERAGGTHFRHKSLGTPALDASNVSHVYAIVTLKSGARVYEVWTRERVLAHKAKYAKNTRDTSPWNTHPLGMWAKCAVRAALRFAPLSPEVRDAISEGDAPLIEDSDPTQALQAGAGLLALGAGMDDAAAMTLSDAEAMTLPGRDGAWGGKAGLPLGDLKDSLLSQVHRWATGDDERRVKFAALATACEIIMASREDGTLSDTISEAA